MTCLPGDHYTSKRKKDRKAQLYARHKQSDPTMSSPRALIKGSKYGINSSDVPRHLLWGGGRSDLLTSYCYFKK